MSEREITDLRERVALLESILTQVGNVNKESKKHKFSPKRQDLILNGMSKALCIETVDPLKENRVRFFHPLLHHPKTPILSLPFARAVSSMGGFDDCGLNWVPPAGSTLHIFFDMGMRQAPYYVGTSWHRNRGPGWSKWSFPSREIDAIYKGHRKGYLVGPNDESQVFPPWNTESYNGFDQDSIDEFSDDPQEQIRTTYPNIYGFKTPEKHMFKMVDGNAKCNRRWKRIEILSGCGNWMIFKDDHLHYGGQWAHPSCPPDPSGGSADICSTHSGDKPYFTDLQGTPIEGDSDCGANIIFGHPSTPDAPPDGGTKYVNSNTGSNKFFKHQNECRPYRGPGTPQNNKCDLPQTGIQFMSIAGNTLVMDDSVEEPRGKPEWERSLDSFDFGCNNKYVGVYYLKSALGQEITMSDVEELPGLRGAQTYMKLRTQSGNRIELNEHTVGSPDCTPCPPNYAGEERGVHIESSSKHKIRLCDHMNEQCGPCRQEGGTPANNATKAYIQIRSGYGLEMRYNDDFSQQETQNQWIQITNPQCAGDSDEKCNRERGPHFMRFQGRPKGEPGVIFLRAGGHSVRSTYDMDVVLVGDKEKNPSDKFTYVSKNFITSTEKVHFRYAGEQHIFFAEDKIFLMAGRDCPPEEGKRCKGPCVFPVIVARCPVICPFTGLVHWTEQAVSERVFASAFNSCQNGGCKDAQGNVVEDCEDYESQMSAAPGPPCDSEYGETDIDTGQGTVTTTGSAG